MFTAALPRSKCPRVVQPMTCGDGSFHQRGPPLRGRPTPDPLAGQGLHKVHSTWTESSLAQHLHLFTVVHPQ